MEIQIIKEPINRSTLENIAIDQFIDLVKAVVDVEQEIMAIGGEFHSDEEVELISKEGSLRENTWGINLYIKGDEFIEYDFIMGADMVKCPHCGVEVSSSLFFDEDEMFLI